MTNASGKEAMLRKKRVNVDILEDPVGIARYSTFRIEKPEHDLEDWQGFNAVLYRSSQS